MWVCNAFDIIRNRASVGRGPRACEGVKLPHPSFPLFFLFHPLALSYPSLGPAPHPAPRDQVQQGAAQERPRWAEHTVVWAVSPLEGWESLTTRPGTGWGCRAELLQTHIKFGTLLAARSPGFSHSSG